MANLTHNAAPDVEKLGEFYDQRYSGEYCFDHGKGRHWMTKRCLVECVPDRDKPLRVLDYGCGSGGLVELLVEMFPNSEIYGIDVSETAIDTAKSRFPDHHFSAFDGNHAPHSDGFFDVVFSNHVLEHVADLKQSLSDMARLVRSGGFLCLTLPCGNENSLEWRLTMLSEGGVVKSVTNEDKWFWEDKSHLRRLKSSQLIAELEPLGFTLESQFFGNQFWGGVADVCGAGPVLVNDLLTVGRAKGVVGKSKMLLAKLLFLPLSLKYLTHIKLGEKVKNSRGMKRALFVAAVPIKLLLLLPSKAIERLAVHEWKHRRFERNGASQFLFLQKQGQQ